MASANWLDSAAMSIGSFGCAGIRGKLSNSSLTFANKSLSPENSVAEAVFSFKAVLSFFLGLFECGVGSRSN
jgi:hypothetical protein